MPFKLSTILSALGHQFTGAITKNLPALEASAKAELTSVEQSISTFATTDLGKLAIDAVALVPAGIAGPTAFASAKAQFLADAKTAGHDLTTTGSGVVDWMVQTAYTYTAGVFASFTPPAA